MGRFYNVADIIRWIRSSFGYEAEVSFNMLWDRIHNREDIHYRYAGFQKRSWSRKKEKYFILRLSYPWNGLGAVVRRAVMCAPWAEKNGYKLVVDYRDRNDIYDDPKGEYTLNVWDMFFEQGLLPDIYRSANTIFVSPVDGYVYESDFYRSTNNDPEDYSIHILNDDIEYRGTWKRLFTRYCVLKNEVIERLDEEWERLCKNKKSRIVGISIREEFMKDNSVKKVGTKSLEHLQYHNHHESMNEVVQMIKEKVKEWEIQYIYLATYYDETIERFQEEFGESNVIYAERNRLRKYHDVDQLNVRYGIYYEQDKDEHERLMTLLEKDGNWNDFVRDREEGYFKELYFLAKCNCFISGVCSSSVVVQLMRPCNFDKIFIYGTCNNEGTIRF